MEDKTWLKNASAQITLNSIFAAFVGVFIALATTDNALSELYKLQFIEICLLLISFVMFALSAECTLDALDEKDVKKYVYYMLWYNIAVILLGISMAILIYAHFFAALKKYISPAHPWITYVIFILFFLVLFWKWFNDTWWLIRATNKKMTAFLDELEGKTEPKSNPSCLMRKFYESKDLDL